MRADLALMCKSHNYWMQGCIKNGQPSSFVKVGNWVISSTRQDKLIGGTVVLTEARSTPAYLGGRIIGFNPTPDGKCEVVFESDLKVIGNRDAVGHRGWGSGRGVCYVV